jgi:signal transduction histidine kinase
MVEEQMSTRLTHDSESLLSRLQFNNSEQIQINSSEIDSIYHRPFSGHYFIIQSGTSTLRSRSLWDQDLALPSALASGSRQIRVKGPQQQPLLVVQNVYQKQGRQIVISVAEDLTLIDMQIADFRNWFGLLALVVLLALVLLQVFIVHHSLKPLHRNRQQLAELEAGQRTQLDTQVPSELQPLVTEFNHLLHRLGQRLQRSRNALGDLAHALKKPLTVLTQLSEDDCIRQCKDLQQQITYQSGEIKRNIDHVLKRARLAGEGPAIAQFSLQRDLPPLLDTLRSMYPDKVIVPTLTLHDHDLVPFDREDMMELLGNILDNACKWAQHQLSLSLDINTALRIVVEDDGPGISSDDLRRFTARGTRLDENIQGHGLGLSIVRDIIQQYAGDISFTNAHEYNSGLCVEISLPLKQAEGSSA